MTARWVEVGDGVLVRRYAELDLSIGLVLGDGGCLVVDARGDLVQGAELAAAVRRVTPLPWTVVITHAHWDHSFGTASLLPSAVWAHENCRADLARNGHRQRANVAAMYREQGRTADAEHVERVEPVLPDRLVTDRAELSVGGRRVVLAYFGPAHSDNDLVAHVPDAGVVYAGDLVEQGAPPAFEDAYPQSWPTALDGILGLVPTVVVPGHGNPVDVAYVTQQRAEIDLLGKLSADVVAGRCGRRDALARSPYAENVLDTAIRRTQATRPDVGK
ncbi:MAG TPA: MBL fold metallo-hydrolase [Pseudonocardiaceae bacterium]|jgi:glyoxylase-like metal-dependent hydrolase (beta-lactamase superfamily II)|nr:MBL fold metallo-hydrolase [Pseudonocardiaceae bacterium]